MQQAKFNGALRKRLINEVRSKISSMGLDNAYESKSRFQKTYACSMLLNEIRFLVLDYTVAQLSDLLTQASGVAITTFLNNPVALVREAATQAELFY